MSARHRWMTFTDQIQTKRLRRQRRTNGLSNIARKESNRFLRAKVICTPRLYHQKLSWKLSNNIKNIIVIKASPWCNRGIFNVNIKYSVYVSEFRRYLQSIVSFTQPWIQENAIWARYRWNYICFDQYIITLMKDMNGGSKQQIT